MASFHTKLTLVDVFPGPTIEARSGDILIVEVSNFVGDEGVSIHWHGLHMKGEKLIT